MRSYKTDKLISSTTNQFAMNHLSRRRFLKGVGATVGLPALESITPPLIAHPAPSRRSIATTASGAPLRMAYLYIPNGVNMSQWRPKRTGQQYSLNKTFQPLADLKDNFQIISGFEQKNGKAGMDGAGDHARGGSTFLTSSRPLKTAGSNIKLGISIDQVAAQALGSATRFPSLELSSDINRRVGSCDSGYACAYVHNISWRSETLPMAPEINPRAVFEKLFGSGKPNERAKNFHARITGQKSIIDFISDDIKSLPS